MKAALDARADLIRWRLSLSLSSPTLALEAAVVAAPAAAANAFRPARVPSTGFRAAQFLSKCASSCSLLVLLLPFKQDLLPASALRGLFSVVQPHACIV